MNVIEGQLSAGGMKFAVVASRFNELITRRLVEGAADAIRRHGGDPESLTLAWVPGAVEIPVVAKRLAASGDYHAVITLGAVIRGATSHYDYVCSAVTSGVSAAALDTGVPVIFGVLTVDSLEQAFERAGSKAGNKGFEAAVAAIEMASLMQRLGDAGGV